MEINILKSLNSDGTFYVFNGILECVKNKVKSKPVVQILQILKQDGRLIAGFRISHYSIAALDILEIEKYKGNDTDIKRLIESKLDFQ